MGTMHENVILNNILALCDNHVPKISFSKMCVDLGLSRSLQTKLKENPEKDIKGDTAQKIADYFGVSVERVLGSEQQKKPAANNGNELSESKQKLMDFIQEVPEDKIEMIFRVIRSIAESD